MGEARATRLRQPVDQRYESAYVFGWVCPARDTGLALILPQANTWAMQQHLDEASKHFRPGSHAIVLLDNAGWYRGEGLEQAPRRGLAVRSQ